MFRVSAIQSGEPIKIPTLSWERREFSSNVAGRSVVYSEPNEFHMGATAWRLKFLENNRDVTQLHPKLAEANRDGGFLLPTNFHPWSSDGGLLSLPTWKGHHFIYNVSEEQIIKSEIDGLVDTLLWSPTSKQYFVSVHNHVPTQSRACLLADINSNQIIQLNIGLLIDETGQFWWLKDGTSLIALYRSSKQTHPVIELFDSQTGRSIGKTPADPNHFIP